MIWLLTSGIIACIVIIACIENRSPGWALTVVAVLGGITYLIDRSLLLDTWNYIVNNPVAIGMYAIGYIVVGVLWSIYKWYLYVKKWVNKWGSSRVILEDKISPEENKTLIMTWMGYWPFSFLWFVVDHPLTKLYKWIYTQVSGVYTRISTAALQQNQNNNEHSTKTK